MRQVTADSLFEDSKLLAAKVVESGWRPDAVFAIWRGGAFPAITLHECLRVAGIDARLYPVECKSYKRAGVAAPEAKWLHCSEIFAEIRPGWKILAVDDIFDTGRTIGSLSGIVRAAGAEMKSACVYFNRREGEGAARPDFFARETGGEWIVFPHELSGL